MMSLSLLTSPRTVRVQRAASAVEGAAVEGVDGSVARGMAPSRNAYIDLLRSIAVVRVVVLHTWWLGWTTFVFPSMGIMFALGGSLMAASVDRSGVRAVARRARRVLPSFWALGFVAVPVMLAAGWATSDQVDHRLSWSALNWVIPVFDPPGLDSLDRFWRVLWYLRAYSWLAALSPLLLRVFRRWPYPTMAVPFVALLLAPPGVADNGHLGSALNDLLTYGGLWIIGFAHHDGVLRSMSRRMWLALIAVCVVVAGVVVAPHLQQYRLEVTHYDEVNAFWSAAFALVLLRFRPSMAWLGRRPRLGTVVRRLNGRSMTIFLWHGPAILAAETLMRRQTGFDWVHMAPASMGGNIALLAAVSAFVTIAVLAFGWIEDRARPPKQQVEPPAVAGKVETVPEHARLRSLALIGRG